MIRKKTAYDLSRSQVATPPDIVGLFWHITHQYRLKFSSVLDLGAGDGRFAMNGDYLSYDGIEIDIEKRPLVHLPPKANIYYKCAFNHTIRNYDACIGNPPYVRHHDLDKKWRDSVAYQLSEETGIEINRKCNLYIYFLILAILMSKKDGLVSLIVPYEWVSRPSSIPLRRFIQLNKWHVDVYRFSEPIFNGVITTASVTVIDKMNNDGIWNYFQTDRKGTINKVDNVTGTNCAFLPYQRRGKIWAMRGMSPGTQKVFTLSESERIHAGLEIDDVLPCITSLRDIPYNTTCLDELTFYDKFVLSGAKCWLIKSHEDNLSPRIQEYLNNIPRDRRDTWTCNSREPWYRFKISDVPNLLVSTGFTSTGPKILVNNIKALAIGSVCGIYSDQNQNWINICEYLRRIDFEKRIVSHANHLKKIEIRQLNTVLNSYNKWDDRHA